MSLNLVIVLRIDFIQIINEWFLQFGTKIKTAMLIRGQGVSLIVDVSINFDKTLSF